MKADPERELRDLLQRKGDEGWVPTPPPDRVVKRVRRRQAATAGLASVVAALVGVAGFAGYRALVDPTLTPSGTTATSTVNGVTITYPDGWFLEPFEDVIGQPIADPARAFMSLSNVEPTQAFITCPAEVAGQERAVVMTIMELPPGTDVASLQTWPAQLAPFEPDDPAAGPQCRPSWEFQEAAWITGDRILRAAIGIGLEASGEDRQNMLDAFATMTFTPADGPTEAPLYHTLTEGVAGGVAWELWAEASVGQLTILLRWSDGEIGVAALDSDLAVETYTFGEGPEAEIIAFGAVTTGADLEVVTTDGDATGTADVGILDVAAAFDPDHDAFAVVVPVAGHTVFRASVDGEVVAEVEIQPTDATASEPPTDVCEPAGILHIYNGTQDSGLASRAAFELSELGYVVPVEGILHASRAYETTEAAYRTSADRVVAECVAAALGVPGAFVREMDPQDAVPQEVGVAVFLGADYAARFPPVDPVAPEEGGTYWAVYLAWSDDADGPEVVEPATWLEDSGISSPGIRLASCDDRSEDVVHGARYLIAVYLETEGDAEAFWSWYVAERALEGPFNVPIIDVTTSCPG